MSLFIIYIIDNHSQKDHKSVNNTQLSLFRVIKKLQKSEAPIVHGNSTLKTLTYGRYEVNVLSDLHKKDPSMQLKNVENIYSYITKFVIKEK